MEIYPVNFTGVEMINDVFWTYGPIDMSTYEFGDTPRGELREEAIRCPRGGVSRGNGHEANGK